MHTESKKDATNSTINKPMTSALIIVERLLPGETGRRVVVRCPEAERCIGVAHSDMQLLDLLAMVGLTGYEDYLDEPRASRMVGKASSVGSQRGWLDPARANPKQPVRQAPRPEAFGRWPVSLKAELGMASRLI